jgi:hypothetical protein
MFLWNEGTPIASPQAFIMLVCYISVVFDFTAHHKEVGGF